MSLQGTPQVHSEFFILHLIHKMSCNLACCFSVTVIGTHYRNESLLLPLDPPHFLFFSCDGSLSCATDRILRMTFSRRLGHSLPYLQGFDTVTYSDTKQADTYTHASTVCSSGTALMTPEKGEKILRERNVREGQL